MRYRRIAALLTLGFLLGPSTAALASATCPKTSLSDAEGRLMCVSCGVPLAIAEAPQADGERRLINRLIAGCESLSQIKQEMVAQYGPNVLSLPPARGTNLAVYLVPAAAAAAALVAIGLLLARWRRRGGPASATPLQPAPPLSHADANRLDDELAHFDR